MGIHIYKRIYILLQKVCNNNVYLCSWRRKARKKYEYFRGDEKPAKIDRCVIGCPQGGTRFRRYDWLPEGSDGLAGSAREDLKMQAVTSCDLNCAALL